MLIPDRVNSANSPSIAPVQLDGNAPSDKGLLTLRGPKTFANAVRVQPTTPTKAVLVGIWAFIQVEILYKKIYIQKMRRKANHNATKLSEVFH